MANPDASIFPATRWTLIERVRAGSEQEKRSALEILCRAYWHPLYCVARRRGLTEHDAMDAVQGFFESLLRRESLGSADETVGRLRHFLLGAFERYCAQQWQKAHRQKRGGGAEHIPLEYGVDVAHAEERFLQAGPQQASVEVLYVRDWAAALLERSLAALREDYVRRGWQERYELLVAPLLREEEGTLEALAAGAAMTAGALRVTLHRMRGHYREKIEREIAETLDTDDPQFIRQELMELFKAFA